MSARDLMLEKLARALMLDGRSDHILYKLAESAALAAQAKAKGMEASEYKRLMSKVRGGAGAQFVRQAIPQKGPRDQGSEKAAMSLPAKHKSLLDQVRAGAMSTADLIKKLKKKRMAA